MIMDLQLLVGENGIIGCIILFIGSIIIPLVTATLSRKAEKAVDVEDNKGIAKEHKFNSFLSKHKGKLLVIWAICVVFALFNVVVTFISSLQKVSVSQIEYSYSVKDDKTVCITGLLDESITNLEIPEEILGKDVTEIGDRAFEDCTSITSVTIPASVKLIGTNAFLNCTSLTHINVVDDNEHYSSAEGILFNKNKTKLVCYPDGKNIGEVVKSGTCGDNLTWDLYESGVLIISGCGWMWDFEDISTNPWHDNCLDVTSVIFNGSVTSIGTRAFQGCSNLKNIVIPDSITKFEGAAFRECSALTSVTVPNSLIEIKASTFYGCSSLTDITLPDSINSIGGCAFYSCSSLSNIVIPESVTWIGELAFYCCSSLKSITLPNSLTEIGKSAFAYCNNLSNVELPNSITYIGECAFLRCSNLKSINIPDSVTEINHDIFSGCTSLVDIKMPKSADVIDYGVFYKCANLKSIVIPDGVSSIERDTFSGCSSLTSATIPHSVTSIGKYVFWKCTNLTAVYYAGSEEDWKKIKIDASTNTCLTQATIHYNSQANTTAAD